MAMRPLEPDEFKQIITLVLEGFTTSTGAKFRPNKQVALILQLQASLGLRIGDVMGLQVKNFRNGKLENVEAKTGKLQYRSINPAVIEAVKEYAGEKGLAPEDKLFDISIRAVQKQLTLVTEHLGLEYIGTHSFRKMFATMVYQMNGNDIELLKELLNHTCISTTQRYIRVNQSAINAASAGINFMT